MPRKPVIMSGVLLSIGILAACLLLASRSPGISHEPGRTETLASNTYEVPASRPNRPEPATKAVPVTRFRDVGTDSGPATRPALNRPIREIIDADFAALSLLFRREGPEAASQAAGSLARDLTDPEAIAPFMALLRNETNVYIVMAVLEGLAKRGMPADIRAIANKTTFRNTLWSAFADETDPQRKTAYIIPFICNVALRDPGIDAGIVNIAGGSDAADLRRYALAALRGQYANPDALSVLQRVAASDSDPNVRATAVFALGGATDSQSVRLIESAAVDPCEAVRSAAVDAMPVPTTPAKEAQLLSVLSHDFPVARTAEYRVAIIRRWLSVAPASLAGVLRHAIETESDERAKTYFEAVLHAIDTGVSDPTRIHAMTARERSRYTSR